MGKGQVLVRMVWRFPLCWWPSHEGIECVAGPKDLEPCGQGGSRYAGTTVKDQVQACSLRVSGVQAASTPELAAPPSVCGEHQGGD